MNKFTFYAIAVAAIVVLVSALGFRDSSYNRSFECYASNSRGCLI